MKPERSIVVRYAIALVAVGLAVAGRAWAAHAGLGPYRVPFLQSAIIVSALFGGVGPGTAAVVIATIAWTMFLPPIGKPWITHPMDAIDITLFASMNALIAWAFGTARQQWRSAAGRRGSAPRETGTTANRASSRVQVRSPLAIAGLATSSAALAAFGYWGAFTAAGSEHFQEEMTSIPLTCLGLAPAVLIFGLGFLPVFTFAYGPPDPARSSR